MKKDPVTKLVNPASQERKLVNHIALVVDRSGSMGHLTNDVIRVLNEQVANIKKNAYDSGQETRVSLYLFSTFTKSIVVGSHPEAVPLLTSYDYQPDGGTALFDAVRMAADNMHSADNGSADTSFLLVALTDGEENSSRLGPIDSLIRQKQGTDRWSFAFLVPPGGRRTVENLGVPAGNVIEWEGTKAGLDRAAHVAVSSVSNYYAARAAGHSKSTSFFTDLSKVKTSDLKKLDDVSHDFKRWKVTKEQPISEFVSGKRFGYLIGRGYYELTKPEKVQSHKDFVIADRNTLKLYGGDQARDLIGVPAGPGVTVKVVPGNHSNYKIFVQSTSMNRILVRGSEFLYRS